MAEIGAIELGGTTTRVAKGPADSGVGAITRFATSGPEETIERILGELGRVELDAVGIASFGPLELRPTHPEFGRIVATPKEGWSGTNLTALLDRAFGVPIVLETDVNAAALAESEIGAAIDDDHVVYVTIGTGIGVGIARSGRVVRGLSHPEAGHVAVRHEPDDDFTGLCPFHGDCLEGMASGPALEARFGRPPDQLDDHEVEKATDLVSYYVAQGLLALVLTISPQRIVVGGGVSRLSHMHAVLHDRFLDEMAGYRVLDEHRATDFITAPALADHAGLVGAYLLARQEIR